MTCLLTVAARRAQWLLNVADGPDKPFATHGAHEVHLVESWEPPATATATATATAAAAATATATATATAAAATTATAEERSEYDATEGAIVAARREDVGIVRVRAERARLAAAAAALGGRESRVALRHQPRSADEHLEGGLRRRRANGGLRRRRQLRRVERELGGELPQLAAAGGEAEGAVARGERAHARRAAAEEGEAAPVGVGGGREHRGEVERARVGHAQRRLVGRAVRRPPEQPAALARRDDALGPDVHREERPLPVDLQRLHAAAARPVEQHAAGGAAEHRAP